MDYILSQIERIADELRENGVKVPGKSHSPPRTIEIPEDTEVVISRSSRSKIHLPRWLQNHRHDPAFTVTCHLLPVTNTDGKTPQHFMHLLLCHIHERLFPNEDETEQIFIENDLLYEHPILNIEYTSYDAQREQDIVHIGYGRTGVMVYTPAVDGNEPWSYANILAVYHLIVRTASNPKPKRLVVPWVRWMERSTSGLTGPNSRNYTRVSFVPWSDVAGSTFDFIDPSHIIRSCHLIPAFDLGRSTDLLGPSEVRDSAGDWHAFYANRCDPEKLIYSTLIMVHAWFNRTGLPIEMPLRGSGGLGLDANGFNLPECSMFNLVLTMTSRAVTRSSTGT